MNSDYYINLHFNQAIPQKTGYAFKIGDKGCTFHLHCVDLNPTGMNPHIVFNHSNGTCVEGVPTGSGQDYVYVIQGNEFGVCGQVVVDMKFYDAIGELATQRISTASFTLDVIPDTLTPFDESSSSYADSLEHAREELEDATGDLADMDALFAQTLQDYIDAFGNTAPINPRGEYDPNELYKPRDAVYYTHDGKTVTYLNNLECTGIAPTNTSNWQPIIDIPSLPAVIDNCTSTSTTDALSANQGRVLNDNISAIVNVNGSKNLLKNKGISGTYGGGCAVTFNKDGSITLNGTYTIITPGTREYILLSDGYNDTDIDWLKALDGKTLTLSKGAANIGLMLTTIRSDFTAIQNIGVASNKTAETFTLNLTNQFTQYNAVLYIDETTTFNNITVYPMLRDARIVDPTYEPYAETNQQLTVNKAERADLASLKLTGSTNTTGATIIAGTYFYLNGSFCIALQDIGINATFTKGTNYKVTSVGEGWQIESTAECIPNTGCSFTGIASGDRLRVVRFKNGLKMLCGLITVDDPSLIQDAYLATLPTGYEYKSSALQYNIWTTFISYNGNPAIVGVINGSQHVVHWFPVPLATGYCVSPTLFY